MVIFTALWAIALLKQGKGPTVVTDLYTIGRTLAVLLTDIKGFSKEHLYTLPSPQEEPLFAEQESLYRFLIKATAENPDDRFQSADEMADQLLGVLREVVAIDTNIPRPSSSSLFGGDMLALINSGDFEPIIADYRQLPVPTLDSSDSAFNSLLNVGAIADVQMRVLSLDIVTKQYPTSSEAWLRLANSLIDWNRYEDAEEAIVQVESKDPWDWRIFWYRGRLLMAQDKYVEAQKVFDQVYFDLPGEIAPKLALGLAAEQAKHYQIAIKMYDLVSRIDPSYVSASFGLARCLSATGARKDAVAALSRVPQTTNLFTLAQVEIAQTLINRGNSAPGISELQTASVTIETLALEGMTRYRLTKAVLETTLSLLTTKILQSAANIKILGQPLEEVSIRIGLEKALRDMARLATGVEKIRLVDEANRVRPRTMF